MRPGSLLTWFRGSWNVSSTYQDRKFLEMNWNPFLSKHLCNANFDRPPAPTLRLAEGISEPTVLSEPTVHPPRLKSSAATRRELSFPDYNYTNGNYNQEDDQNQG